MSVPRTSMLVRLMSLTAGALVTISATASAVSVAANPLAPALTRMVLPAGAAANAQRAGVGAVSCGAVNSCVAVGSYVAGGVNVPFVATETRGHWSTATSIALPSDAIGSASSPSGPITQLTAVSCVSVGNCVGVGTYKTAAGFEAMRIVETAGLWKGAQRVALPGSAATSYQSAALFAVSCAGLATCTAVGTFTDTLGRQLPLAISEHAGIWSGPVSPTLPSGAIGPDQLAQLSGIDCASVATCIAVGGFVDADGYEAMALTQSAGQWQPATTGAVIAPPTGAAALATSEGNGLNAVSCTSSTQCVAVGQFAVSTGYVAVTTSWSGTTWSTAAVVTAPSSPVLVGALVHTLTAVSCVSSSTCTAVGTYGTTTVRRPFTATLSGTTWSAAPGSTALADAAAPAYGEYHGVACFSALACVIVGDYHATTGTQGLVLTPVTAPGAPTGLVVARGNQSLVVSWAAPLYNGTTPLTGFRATASPDGAHCETALLTCRISGLHNGQAYTVTVVAMNAVGSSAPTSPSRPIAPATIASAPRIAAIASLAGALRLTLVAPVDNGGSGIVTYDYSLNGGTTWHVRHDGTTSLSVVITGLLRAHVYHVTVRAVNGAGTGAASPIVVAKTK